MHQKKLILPNQGILYSCLRCGLCCKTDWLIGIDEISYKRLSQYNWASYFPQLSNNSLFVKLKFPLPSGETVTFARKSDGACIFLTSENECLIHQQLGFDAKAQVCKEFPYRFVSTPKGIIVGLSFACVSVNSGIGEPLANKQEEINKILTSSLHIEEIEEPLPLYGLQVLSWKEYEGIESSLISIINANEYSLDLALFAGSILLNVCIGLKQVEEKALQAKQTPKETLLGGLDKLAQDKYQRLFNIAKKGKPSEKFPYVYFAPLLTWMEFSEKKLGRLQLFYSFLNYLLRIKFDLPIKPFFAERKFKMTQISASFENSHISDFLRRYLCHVLFRKNFVCGLGIFRGYHTLLLLYSMIKWIAAFCANAENREVVNIKDLQRAVRIIELKFVLHSRFRNLFFLNPIFSLFLDQIYLKPQFAPTMCLYSFS